MDETIGAPSFRHLVLHLMKLTGKLADAAEKMDHDHEREAGRRLAAGFHTQYVASGTLDETISMMKERLKEFASPQYKVFEEDMKKFETTWGA